MKARGIILLLGIVLYIGSFFMPAVLFSGPESGVESVSGVECAYLALVMPFEAFNNAIHQRGQKPAALTGHVVLLASGLINPVFLVTLIVLFVKPKNTFIRILRTVLLLMFIAPLFYLFHPGAGLYPRFGYFVWMAAMLLVLFADKLEKLRLRSKQPEVAA